MQNAKEQGFICYAYVCVYVFLHTHQIYLKFSTINYLIATLVHFTCLITLITLFAFIGPYLVLWTLLVPPKLHMHATCDACEIRRRQRPHQLCMENTPAPELEHENSVALTGDWVGDNWTLLMYNSNYLRVTVHHSDTVHQRSLSPPAPRQGGESCFHSCLCVSVHLFVRLYAADLANYIRLIRPTNHQIAYNSNIHILILVSSHIFSLGSSQALEQNW